MDLLKLKSGSDIRGTAVESENSPVELTDQAVSKITAAFFIVFRQKNGRTSPKNDNFGGQRFKDFRPKN